MDYYNPNERIMKEQTTDSLSFPGFFRRIRKAGSPGGLPALFLENYLLSASLTATATATVAPTIGLLPMPRKPIISTCAGTEEEPAN